MFTTSFRELSERGFLHYWGKNGNHDERAKRNHYQVRVLDIALSRVGKMEDRSDVRTIYCVRIKRTKKHGPLKHHALLVFS